MKNKKIQNIIEKWVVKDSSYLFKNKYLTVRKDRVITQKGVEIPDFFVIENPNWINVIAITEDGLFVMEEQYRHGLGIIEHELCAGMIEDGESPLEAAKRELKEETGYAGGDWKLFMKSSPNPSSMNNINYTFLAKGVKKQFEQRLDNREFINVSLLTKDEIKALLDRDEITEGIMQAPLWKYFAI